MTLTVRSAILCVLNIFLLYTAHAALGWQGAAFTFVGELFGSVVVILMPDLGEPGGEAPRRRRA